MDHLRPLRSFHIATRWRRVCHHVFLTLSGLTEWKVRVELLETKFVGIFSRERGRIRETAHEMVHES